MLANKIFLITGGTGSFGKTMVKYLLENTAAKQIIIFSRDEEKQDAMRIDFNNDKLRFIVGDVRNYDDVNRALYGVDYVFQAAALKQVPSCEFFPMEAVKTNILGTDNVLKACIVNGIKKAVVLSTDKAAYPINAMGISKAMAEKIMIANSRNTANMPNYPTFCATRYGNVMASRGSVIPLFIKQIKHKLPITITQPDMTRFLMSLEESVYLVMHAFEFGNSGDIFVQKSVSCKILDLANALLKIFDAHNPIQIMGIRHGEKNYETLITKEEMARATDEGDFYKISADMRNINYALNDNGEISKTKRFEKEFNSDNTIILNSVDDITEKLYSSKIVSELLPGR
jgi:UDP-glucose 4-epimerase